MAGFYRRAKPSAEPMRRLPYLLSLVLLVACDPDLTVASKPGADAAAEVGVDPGPGPVTPDDAGGTTGDASTQDDGGTTEEDSGGTTTHKIDGVNDFKDATDKFITSSAGYEGFVAWDSKNLYLGMSGTDIGAGASATKWVLVYVDGGAQTTQTGQSYGGQQPTLPFAASFHVGLKTDLSFTNKQKWDGGNWVDAGFSFVPVAARKNSFLEVAIPLAALGNPTKVKVHVSMINEASGGEWTYSAMPSTSITDGLDPNYSKYFEFDLADTTKAPNQYQPK
jgi:hypothetical protein